MKRSLAATAAMLVLAAAVLVTVTLRLDGTATPLAYTAHLVRGDAAAAEGLRFQSAIQYGSRLRWTTEYDVASDQWETVHTLGRDTRQQYYDRQVDPSSRSYDAYNTQYISVLLQSGDPLVEHLKAGYEANAESNDTGYRTEYTERVRLRDYYDVYPLCLSDSRAGVVDQYFDGDVSDQRSLTRFDKLRIPVGEDDWMKPTVSTYGQGHWYLSGDNTLYAESTFTGYSLAYEKALLTTVGFGPSARPQADWAPEGFGLWYIPYAEFSHEYAAGSSYIVRKPDVDNARLVCPLDIAAQRVVGLQFTYDRSEVLLTTAEDGQYVLRVLDADTFQCRQTIALGPTAAPIHVTDGMQPSGELITGALEIYTEPSYNSREGLLVCCISNTLTVLRPSGGGWAVDFSTTLLWPDSDENGMAWSDTPIAYNVDRWWYGVDYSRGFFANFPLLPMVYHDGKLALASSTSGGNQILVEVYDATGLLYGAVLDAGLDSQLMSTPWGFYNPLYCPNLYWD